MSVLATGCIDDSKGHLLVSKSYPLRAVSERKILTI